MANKYHFNKETGRANICRAVKNCPLGADTPHFDNKVDAKNYVEAEAKESNNAFNSISKKNTVNTLPPFDGTENLSKLKELRDEVIGTAESSIRNADGLRKVLGDDSFKKIIAGNTATLNALNEAIEAKEKESAPRGQETYQSKSGALNNLNKKSNSPKDESIYNNEKLIKEYSDPSVIADYVQDYRENHDASVKDVYYSLYAGKLNPVRNIGSGSEYFEPGDNSVVVLSSPDGRGVRVISGAGESFGDNPENHLGEPVVQYKQQGNSPDTTKDLNVVGYISSDGKPYGYIPDKQVSFFVFK